MLDKLGAVGTMGFFLAVCALGVPREALVFIACTLAGGLVMALIVGVVLRRNG